MRNFYGLIVKQLLFTVYIKQIVCSFNNLRDMFEPDNTPELSSCSWPAISNKSMFDNEYTCFNIAGPPVMFKDCSAITGESLSPSSWN